MQAEDMQIKQKRRARKENVNVKELKIETSIIKPTIQETPTKTITTQRLKANPNETIRCTT